jgi:hypothetical protein
MANDISCEDELVEMLTHGSLRQAGGCSDSPDTRVDVRTVRVAE